MKISKLLLSISSLFLLLGGCNASSNEEQPSSSSSSSSSTPIIPFEEDDQGLAFYPLDDGTYGVGVGNAIYLTSIVIPSTFRGRSVTKIIESGFYEQTRAKHLTIPASIKAIEDYGCYDSSLETLKYLGTMEEFNQIKFGTSWLPNWSVSKLKFEFSDQNFFFKDLFPTFNLTLEMNRYSNYQVPMPNNSVTIYRDYGDDYYRFILSSETDYFGGFELNGVLRTYGGGYSFYEVESSNTNVIKIEDNFLRFVKVGETDLTFRLFDTSKTIHVTVTNEYVQQFEVNFQSQQIHYDGEYHSLLYTGILPTDAEITYTYKGEKLTSMPSLKDKGYYSVGVRIFKYGYVLYSASVYVFIANTFVDEYMNTLKANSQPGHLYVHFVPSGSFDSVYLGCQDYYSSNRFYIEFDEYDSIQVYGGYCFDIDLSKTYKTIQGDEVLLTDFNQILIGGQYRGSDFIEPSQLKMSVEGGTAFHAFFIEEEALITTAPSLNTYRPDLDI